MCERAHPWPCVCDLRLCIQPLSVAFFKLFYCSLLIRPHTLNQRSVFVKVRLSAAPSLNHFVSGYIWRGCCVSGGCEPHFPKSGRILVPVCCDNKLTASLSVLKWYQKGESSSSVQKYPLVVCAKTENVSLKVLECKNTPRLCVLYIALSYFWNTITHIPSPQFHLWCC